MPGKIDWNKIKKDYLTGTFTAAELAQKYGVPLSTLQKRMAKEKWKKAKEKTGNQVAIKTAKKTVEKVSTRLANKAALQLDRELEAANLLTMAILDALQDQDQFRRYIVEIRGEKLEEKEEKGMKKQVKVKVTNLQEQLFEKRDAKALMNMASALASVEATKRRILGLLTAAEEKSVELAEKRLAMDREKMGVLDDEGRECGIVQLPSVDLEAYEKEQAAFLEQYKKDKEEGEKNNG